MADADVIIVGAGTAGLTAAIYVQRAGKKALVFEEAVYGGQIVNTPDIENYPGIAHISGYEFATGLYNQATELGAEVRFEKVLSIENEGAEKRVKTTGGEYTARAVILATGAKNRALGLPREKELTGRGISYCATCDGAFFRGKEVAVNGGGNTALEDAAYLANGCSKVYVIHRRDQFRGDAKADPAIISTVTALFGEKKLEGIEVTNKVTGEKRTLPVAALFVAIGQEPDNAPFANVAALDGKGYIEAGEDCRTETEGIYTAGDCRTKEVRQLTTAAADGAVAAMAACGRLN